MEDATLPVALSIGVSSPDATAGSKQSGIRKVTWTGLVQSALSTLYGLRVTKLMRAAHGLGLSFVNRVAFVFAAHVTLGS
jgi:hypothetical protein